jgi:hypothetical protein
MPRIEASLVGRKHVEAPPHGVVLIPDSLPTPRLVTGRLAGEGKVAAVVSGGAAAKTLGGLTKKFRVSSSPHVAVIDSE